MASANLVSTGKPGEFIIPATGQRISLKEWREEDIYDTLAIPAATQLAGNTVQFFTNLAGKQRVDTNLTRQGVLPSRHEMIVHKPSIFVMSLWGTANPILADQMAIYGEGSYTLEKGRREVIPDTHLWWLASGYGYVAYGIEAAAAPAVPVAPGNLGIASPGAVPPLLIPFTMDAQDDFNAQIAFAASGAGLTIGGNTATFTSHTLGDDVAIKNFLRGFVKQPATN